MATLFEECWNHHVVIHIYRNCSQRFWLLTCKQSASSSLSASSEERVPVTTTFIMFLKIQSNILISNHLQIQFSTQQGTRWFDGGSHWSSIPGTRRGDQHQLWTLESKHVWPLHKISKSPPVTKCFQCEGGEWGQRGQMCRGRFSPASLGLNLHLPFSWFFCSQVISFLLPVFMQTWHLEYKRDI